MDGSVYLTKSEACEALRDYLTRRGAMPPDATVVRVFVPRGAGAIAEIEYRCERPTPSRDGGAAKGNNEGGGRD